MNAHKIIACLALVGSWSVANASVEVVDELSVNADTTIDVAEGCVKRINTLSGTNAALITKTGAGTLEVGLVVNAKITLDITAGTFKPIVPVLKAAVTGSTDIAYRFDASDASSMTLLSQNGTNFVTQWKDADGRNQTLTRYSICPYPFLETASLNGRQVIDFGALYNSSYTTDKGYGAAMSFSYQVWPNEVYYIWMDDPTAQTRESSSSAMVGPSVLNAGGCYRGKGGNGTAFNMFTTIPDRVGTQYLVDDYRPKTPAYAPGDGWHFVRWKADPLFDTEKQRTDYGPQRMGYKDAGGSSRGGFKLAELIVCSNQLDEANSAYVRAYLQAKWLKPDAIVQVNVADGATIDATATAFAAQTLQYAGKASILGSENLCVGVYLALTNELVACDGVYQAPSRDRSATPNLGFAGEGKVSVASGTARGNIVASAEGRFTKLGAGTLELGYLDEGITNVTVEAGTFTYSPLLTAATAIHIDPSRADLRTTVTSDEKELVTKMSDVNDPYQGLIPCTGVYKHKTSVTINKPYVAAAEANGLDLLDFGSLANGSHPDGWGAGMKFVKKFAGTAADLGARQYILVWKDRDDAIDLPLIDGEPIDGPALFGISWAWWRGCGGAGEGFQMQPWSSDAGFRVDVRIDNVKIAPPGLRTYRPSKGLHLFDSMPSGANGYNMEAIGMSEGMNTTNNHSTTLGVWGGLKFGEVMAFRHHTSERQRKMIANAMGVKWFGTSTYALRHDFNSVEVSQGAAAEFPYADVVVTNLTVAGSVSARTVEAKNLTVADGTVSAPLTLSAGGRIIVSETAAGVPCLTAQSVTFAGAGMIVLDAPSVIAPSAAPVKIISVSGGSSVDERIRGWRTTAGDKVVLVRKADGYYLGRAPGLLLIVR